MTRQLHSHEPTAATPRQDDSPPAFAERLELFFGEATDTLCRVYARLPVEAAGVSHSGNVKIRGTITGPECTYARTLPTSFLLAERAAPTARAHLAEAVIPEPCFWTPDLPFLYQARVELVHGNEVLASYEGAFGVRPLGRRGVDLVFNRKRWVLRGASRRSAAENELADWHETGMAMLVAHPDDPLCAAASRVGVLLVAQVQGDQETVVGELRRLGRFPAVGLVVVAADRSLDVTGAPRNLLLAQRFPPGAAVTPAPWAHVAFVDVDERHELHDQARDCKLPIMVMRTAKRLGNAAEARTLCDHLQRDVAGQGEFSGFIV